MIQFQQVPQPLQGITAPKFIMWGWRTRDGKTTKPPLTVTGANASTKEPGDWITLDVALNALKTSNGSFEGVGLVLTEMPGLIALDLDKCIDTATGKIVPWAQELIRRANSYTERTPSGTGLRILGKAPADFRGVHRKIPREDSGELELFHHTRRYITLTGARVPGTSTSCRARPEPS